MGDDRGPHVRTVPTQEFLLSAELLHLDIWRRKEFIFIYSWLTAVVELAYGRLSKINILADKPIPAEHVEMGMREERKCILWSAREVGLI